MDRYLTAMRMTFIRLLRSPATIIVQLGVPLVLVPILGYSISAIPGIETFVKGASGMTFMTITVVVMFQLFSGGFMMTYVNEAYFTFRQWRMRMLPCRPSVVIWGSLAAGLVVSLLQGLALAAVSTLAFGARFGGFGTVILAFLGLSLFAQLLATLMLLAFRSYGPAFACMWIVAYGSCVLAGMVFPLPLKGPAASFISTYCNPAGLAQTALLGSARGGAAAEVTLCLAVLLGSSALLGILLPLVARRRLA
jgi:ABC-2 type transport system permease protein